MDITTAAILGLVAAGIASCQLTLATAECGEVELAATDGGALDLVDEPGSSGTQLEREPSRPAQPPVGAVIGSSEDRSWPHRSGLLGRKIVRPSRP